MTKQDCLLLATSQLPETFTAEDLVVAAFRAFPGSFALQGFPEYPCACNALSYVQGKRGLVARGLLQRVRPKVYRVTTAGVEMRRRLESTMSEACPDAGARGCGLQ